MKWRPHGDSNPGALARFEAALAAAWSTLTDRERLALGLKFGQGLQGRAIARVMRVSEPRVSHLLDAGIRRLREAMRLRMPGTPPTSRTPDREGWEDLVAALGRHLASPGPETHDRLRPPLA